MSELCVFAGTGEGRELIERLAGRGLTISACVATDYGASLLGGLPGVEVHSGRMDAAEMEAFLAAQGCALVVDATHPYAALVTQNLRKACARLHLPCLRLARAGGAEEEDGCFVPDVDACIRKLLATEGNILLTTGSKELPRFCAEPALRGRIYARVLPLPASLAICEESGVRPDHIIAMQGPFDEELNFALLRATHARVLVSKDSGDAGGYAAKLRSARRAQAQLVVIGRPPQAEGLHPEEVLREIEERFHLAPLRKHVVLAGIGMGDSDSQTLGLRRAIQAADVLIGAQRMLDAVPCEGKPSCVAVEAEQIAAYVRESPARRFTVLLSGDTGFFSGARRLIAALGDAEVRVLPGIGSLQYFCARLQRPWEDVRCVSLHGRDCDLAREVEEHAAVFALLGGEGGAQQALQRLCEAGLGDCGASVGERLGYAQERIRRGSVAELAGEAFDPLSVLLVENAHRGERVLTPGLDDAAFERSDVPMTKSELRAVSLSKLRLTRRSVVYDVGTGSGSVAVEAARIACDGRVWAIERREEALRLARRNVEKFRLRNVELIAGSAPEALEELPAPTHAFIGGSGGRLEEIIDALLRKNPEVRIVVNAVTLETLEELLRLRGRFADSEFVQLNVSKSRPLGGYSLLTAHNPVTIVTLQHPLAAQAKGQA